MSGLIHCLLLLTLQSLVISQNLKELNPANSEHYNISFLV